MINPAECGEEMGDEHDLRKRNLLYPIHSLHQPVWLKLVDLTGGVVWTREGKYEQNKRFQDTAIQKSLRPTLLYNTQDCPTRHLIIKYLPSSRFSPQISCC